jgi:hypothetical protein
MTHGDWARALILAVVVCGVTALAWPDRHDLKAWRTPQTVLSIAGLVVGFVIVSWQLKRQHWNTLDNNIRVAQDRLKAELYEKIAERIEATAVPLRELTITPTAFVGELALRESASADRRHVPPSKYFPKLHGALEEVERTTTALMSIMETYAIVNPEFATFRSRLGECLRHATVAVNDFRELAWQFAGSENLSVIRWPPTDKESKTLSRLASSAESSARSLKTTVSDLCVTAQNYHLGTLFADNTLKAATNSE